MNYAQIARCGATHAQPEVPNGVLNHSWHGMDGMSEYLQTVWLEKLANRPLRPYVAGDAVDKAISEMLAKCVCQPQFTIVRVEEGKYRIGNETKGLLLRILQSVCGSHS